MSLLNDALRDLEKRRPEDGRQVEAPPGLRQAAPPNRRPWLLGTVTALVLLGLGAGLFYQQFSMPGAPPLPNPLSHEEETGLTEPRPATGQSASSPLPPAVADQGEGERRKAPGAATPEPAEAVAAEPPLPKPLSHEEERGLTEPRPATGQLVSSPLPPAGEGQGAGERREAPKAVSPEPAEAVAAEPSLPKSLAPEASAPAAPVKQAADTAEGQDRALAEKIEKALLAGNPSEASRLLEAADQEGRAVPRARSAYVKHLITQGRLAEAKRWLPDSLLADYPALRLLQARLRLKQGDRPGAIEALAGEVPAASAHPDYLATLAALYQQEGQHGQAGMLWANLLEHDSQVADWWAGLGIALDAQGQDRGARAAYRQALALPGLRPALAEYARQRLSALNP